MSYIVPRDKPNRCTNCLFMDRITYDCKLMYGDDYPDFESQYNNCPLTELPPHGRLIDADAVNKAMDERIEKLKDDKSIYEASCVSTALDMFAPTVIEAEGSETDA